MDIVTSVSDLATSGASSAWLLAGNFLVLLMLTGLMIGFSYKAGRGGIISLIVAFYAGYALYIVFPFTERLLDATDSKAIQATISIILYGIMTFIPFHFIQRLTKGGFGVLAFVPRFVLSFLAATFLLTLAYHVFYISNIYTFPTPIDSLFAPDAYFFWWFIAPLVGLLFFVR